MKIDLAALRPHPRNYNRHPAAQVEKIKRSLSRFGQRKPITTWRGMVLTGHGVYEAARALGWSEIWAEPCPEAWTEAEALAWLAADNELARGADPDEDALAALVAGLRDVDAELAALAAGTDERLRELMASLQAQPAGDDPGPQVDKAAELQAKWQTATGQLWQLGEHRLICGDCTDREVVARVMGGERAAGVFTSPPYAMQRKETYGGIPVDRYVDWWNGVQASMRGILAEDGSFFVNIKPHCQDGQRVLYVFDLVLAMVRQWQWLFIDEFCWKRRAVPGGWDSRLRNEFEPVYHFSIGEVKVRKGNIKREPKESTKNDKRKVTYSERHLHGQDNAATGSPFASGRAMMPYGWEGSGVLPSNVIEISLGIEGVSHPAMFPAGLVEFFLNAFSDTNDIWCDPFNGSGTTLIACEKLGRRARCVEIEPGYVAVALERWATMTGKTPALVEPAAAT